MIILQPIDFVYWDGDDYVHHYMVTNSPVSEIEYILNCFHAKEDIDIDINPSPEKTLFSEAIKSMQDFEYGICTDDVTSWIKRLGYHIEPIRFETFEL